MDVPQQALATLREVLRAARLGPRLDGLSVLELGPGDSACSAVIAHALGARQSTLIDAGPFATREMSVYHALAQALETEALPVGAAKTAPDFDTLLSAIGARYLTEGLRSLESLAPASIDFAFSSAVLEHIRVQEFEPMMRALRRAMAPGGLCYHNVDLQDHLAYALNNLRFSDRVWESAAMARSGFYTNRIGYGEMLTLFHKAGFSTEILTVRRFSALPTPREKMSSRFRDRSEEDLIVSGFTLLLRPAS
jgi:hypothetical protein